MKGIYSITNKITNKVYIGGSLNIERRFEDHLSEFERGHRNELLKEDYEKYGIDAFEFNTIVKLDHSYQINRSTLLKLEETIIRSIPKENLYNLQLNTNGAGADTLSRVSYLLDLEGNIIKEYESTNDLFKELYSRKGGNGPYNLVNTHMIAKKKYRVVTKEFYDNYSHIVNNWRPFNNYTELLVDFKNFIRPFVLHCNESGLELTFNTLSEIGSYLGVTGERIRQCYNTETKFRNNFTITKLRKPKDFKYYNWLNLLDRPDFKK